MHNRAAHLFVVSGVIGWPPRLFCRKHALDSKLPRSNVVRFSAVNLHSVHTLSSKNSRYKNGTTKTCFLAFPLVPWFWAWAEWVRLRCQATDSTAVA